MFIENKNIFYLNFKFMIVYKMNNYRYMDNSLS